MTEIFSRLLLVETMKCILRENFSQVFVGQISRIHQTLQNRMKIESLYLTHSIIGLQF